MRLLRPESLAQEMQFSPLQVDHHQGAAAPQNPWSDEENGLKQNTHHVFETSESTVDVLWMDVGHCCFPTFQVLRRRGACGRSLLQPEARRALAPFSRLAYL